MKIFLFIISCAFYSNALAQVVPLRHYSFDSNVEGWNSATNPIWAQDDFLNVEGHGSMEFGSANTSRVSLQSRAQVEPGKGYSFSGAVKIPETSLSDGFGVDIIFYNDMNQPLELRNIHTSSLEELQDNQWHWFEVGFIHDSATQVRIVLNSTATSTFEGGFVRVDELILQEDLVFKNGYETEN